MPHLTQTGGTGQYLQEIIEDGDLKIVIFSEWRRMLELVREQAEEMGLGFAWHTGEVPQPKRRGEIRRFKTDPECRLFLSTDSGSVGLNLQVADIVINMDMPWNPAKLEQRIARAWRKYQKRPVQVINLVAQGTIEQRMLSLLEQKRSLAEGVVDGKDIKEMSLPSGRAAFLERIDSLIAVERQEPKTAPADPFDRLRHNILARWSSQVELMELHGVGEQQTLLVVAEHINDELQSALAQQLQNQFPDQTPQLKLLDRNTFTAIRELIEAGVLSTNQETGRTLYNVSVEETPKNDEALKRLGQARNHLAQSEHKPRILSWTRWSVRLWWCVARRSDAE